jgi:hypothetical protein
MGWVIREDKDGNRFPEYIEEPVTEPETDETVVEPSPVSTSVKVFIHVDENDIIQSWASSKGMDEEFEIEIERDHEFFNSMPFFYKYIEGELIKTNVFAINKARQMKVIELNDECTKAIHSGFEHNGNTFQFNEKDQSNFNQQLSLLLLDATINEVQWKTENNGVQLFTREQFIETCKAGELHKRNSIGQYWTLKEIVLTHDFKSVEEVNAINFNTDISTITNTETGV